jgi:hypothetical protein
VLGREGWRDPPAVAWVVVKVGEEGLDRCGVEVAEEGEWAEGKGKPPASLRC